MHHDYSYKIQRDSPIGILQNWHSWDLSNPDIQLLGMGIDYYLTFLQALKVKSSLMSLKWLSLWCFFYNNEMIPLYCDNRMSKDNYVF